MLVSVIIFVVSVAIADVVSAGGVLIIDDVSVDTVVESVDVSVLDVELSLHATKTVETARAIINFFIFRLSFNLKIYFVFIPELLKGNLCCCMKILHLHLGLLFQL